ncbi:MAG TPA: SAP domain-containing protein [Gammaproteobacteria bacterium]|nr:SAP domain-containing protein [Gammaproteobacteria bacterium]
MHIQEIRTIAREYGLKTSRASKIDIIRAIQRKEGNFDCFATPADHFCDQKICLWKEDCLDSTQKKAS